MGRTKSHVFKKDSLRLAELAKALSHPARIEIIRLLIGRKECVCGSIVSDIPLSQSTVSQHLKVLKSCGFIKGEIDGASVCYCLDEKNWAAAYKELKKFFKSANKTFPECC